MSYQNAERLPALPASFFARPSPEVARALLGHILLHHSPEGITAGVIVETEAYEQTDPASHSFRGKTPRNAPMFGPGGLAYVYRSYGIHLCMNVSCGAEGFGAAVLLRALEPATGIALMAERRGFGPSTPPKPHTLARGPGNLTRAQGILIHHSGLPLTTGILRLVQGSAVPDEDIVATARIGISVAKEVPWRFVVNGHPCASGPKYLNVRAR